MKTAFIAHPTEWPVAETGINIPLMFLLQAVPIGQAQGEFFGGGIFPDQALTLEGGDMTWWPTTLGLICGIVTVIGFMWVVPIMSDGVVTDTFVILERIEWALTAGLLAAYGVTYALPAAA